MLTVFGSINLDVCVRTKRMPKPGETVLGSDALVSPGGKGANQAHAAALFGAATRLYGMVGNDSFATPALAELIALGVDTSGVGVATPQGTGLALITVNAAGDNTIVVAPGANLAARAEQVPDAVLRDSRVLLMQLEVPPLECVALARRARGLGCKVILNASPFPAGFRLEAGVADMLIVNQTELDQLCEQLPAFGIDPLDKARLAAETLGLEVLVTLGAEGSVLARPDGKNFAARASSLPVVDTTGAGDTYAGVFAACAAMGGSAAEAMEAASAAAGLACTRQGAQVAQPPREAIDAELARRKSRTGRGGA
jgi:ribokinase